VQDASDAAHPDARKEPIMSTASNGETWKALMTERGWLHGSKFTIPERHYVTINHTGPSGYVTFTPPIHM